ncbi:two-component system sensor histidine kinase NtrB [Mesorhizobium wenxiniae]|uniref:two-component system sensor histidine kinase NtrB n=1 Tax=Mesorhizobium wenxiniae TaxID=2014805 RepID=UPI001055B5D1|nr:ATP-binding protein [Mesorhizobium wenxiniae]
MTQETSVQLHTPLPSAAAAEQRAAATRRLAALGELTGGMAHDFRNLLTAIGSGLRLAENNWDDPAKLRAYLAETKIAIDGGIALTSQLLAFARHQSLDPHVGNVNEYLHTFEPFLRYGAGPDARLILDLTPDLPNCLLDPAFFDAAVLNLVTNARDAMPNGGRIDISTRHVSGSETPGIDLTSSYVRVRVRDEGCGMPADIIRKVFDPFFTTKGDHGTGFGLPQVRAFMEMVGGTIAISSEPEAGTTVDLLFPSVS